MFFKAESLIRIAVCFLKWRKTSHSRSPASFHPFFLWPVMHQRLSKMITAQCHAVTCIVYNGLWGRKSKLPCAFGFHLLSELMGRKWNKWCKKHTNILFLFMWRLSAVTLSVLTVNCLYKVKNPFHVPLFLLCFNFSQSIWFAHLGDGGTQPPHTSVKSSIYVPHCYCP